MNDKIKCSDFQAKYTNALISQYVSSKHIFSCNKKHKCIKVILSAGVLLMGCENPFLSVGIDSYGAFAPFLILRRKTTPDSAWVRRACEYIE